MQSSKFELPALLTSVSMQSALTYEQAERLWNLLGSPQKLWKAADDANQRGFAQAYEFAEAGVYGDAAHDGAKEVTDLEKLTACLEEIGVKFSTGNDPLRKGWTALYLEDSYSASDEVVAEFTFMQDGKFGAVFS